MYSVQAEIINYLCENKARESLSKPHLDTSDSQQLMVAPRPPETCPLYWEWTDKMNSTPGNNRNYSFHRFILSKEEKSLGPRKKNLSWELTIPWYSSSEYIHPSTSMYLHPLINYSLIVKSDVWNNKAKERSILIALCLSAEEIEEKHHVFI
jgi:hypothetical protein